MMWALAVLVAAIVLAVVVLIAIGVVREIRKPHRRDDSTDVIGRGRR
jgi:uncharacterized membrane protein